MMTIDNKQSRWFLKWLGVRFLLKKEKEKNLKLQKEVNYWMSKSYDLEKINKDLIKSKREN